ncbi:MAG: type II toxin-antitoxin system RelE/ParE family toxin [Verrucomicrobiaceae bacterium]|nr:MAG: type II toxin-antitoxin system RelE/ParE family toxin [Verrucomicrobiaceae bacterium]
MMVFRLSRRAVDDLEAIYLLGLASFGEEQADRYHESLNATFTLLSDFPEIARERHEIEPPVRIHRHHAHVVIYLVDGADILILRLRHGHGHGHEDWSTNPLG